MTNNSNEKQNLTASSGLVKRKRARKNAMILLFEADARKDEDRNELYRSEMERITGEFDEEYTKAVYDGVMNHISEIDGIISEFANGWSTDRISKASRIIMRISLYEMLFAGGDGNEKIPPAVSINEAVELTKRYDDEKMPGFVNGVLNNASKKYVK